MLDLVVGRAAVLAGHAQLGVGEHEAGGCGDDQDSAGEDQPAREAKPRQRLERLPHRAASAVSMLCSASFTVSPSSSAATGLCTSASKWPLGSTSKRPSGAVTR